ncbi:YceI family protein [Achromobacter sp. DMS1]|uniref:YceI family protein n=1 Tax=Achromobacter sp. DMS1 TaxID=1688405 RepID=UPI001F42CACC|nr:YceI family protein [Achromobacter sp. DMS1]
MLRGPEFFDAATYPYIRFESTSVRDQGDGRLRIEGVLRIKNHEQPVVLEAVRNREGTHPRAGRPAVGFDATATLKRATSAWAPMRDVSDDVELRITARRWPPPRPDATKALPGRRSGAAHAEFAPAAAADLEQGAQAGRTHGRR